MTVPSPHLHVLGIRHHSPACARLVAHEIRRLRPRYVLVEGPADMNGRLDELLRPHRLPIAIFSFHREDGGRVASSWSPLCEYSPEWQALTAGREVGAELRFVDLPAWHPAFQGIANRYGDGDRRHAAAVKALCARFHVDGYDALWDHLFEGPAEGDAALAGLRARLDTYFAGVRGDAPGGDRDGPREEYMRAWIRAALAAGDGPVVVVCGGFHAPALAGVVPDAVARWPEPPPAPRDAASYLVPWSYHRLDSFTGYASGMPSPAFQDAVFASGPGEAPGRMLRAVVAHLRARGQHVSSADLIAALAMAEGLARMRGHDVLRRTDLLDGIAAALVKQSLDAPLPWSERGAVHRDTDALLVAVLEALSGDREGRLDPATPRPPLIADVERTLEANDLVPPQARARTVKLALTAPADLQRSRVLHRLRVLGIPGFRRTSGPTWTTDPEVGETWVLARHELAESTLIEAASYGATLESAAARRLESALDGPLLDLERLAALLGEAAFIGVGSLTARALESVRWHAARETDLGRLGSALERLLGLWSQDALFAARGTAEIATAVLEAAERGLWLLEHVSGSAGADASPVAAVKALRDAARAGGRLAFRADDAVAVFTRRARASDAPPDIRGACLGALWSLGVLGERGAATDAAAQAIRRAATPSQLGDFLVGLFALAREETVHADEVLATVDEVVAAMGEPEFLTALPALRLAFAWFPPRERARIAERVAALHGRPAEAAGLLELDADAAAIARGRRLDLDVDEAMRRFGLLAPEGIR